MRRRFLAILSSVVVVAAAAHAASSNDAGAGIDAGDSRGLALLLPSYGAYTGGLLPSDIDWYKVAESTSSPRCVEGTYAPTSKSLFTLSAQTTNGTRTANVTVDGGATGKAGIAVKDLRNTFLSARDAPSGASYQFTLQSVGVPSASLGDALSGVDAGSTVDTALGVSPGCIGGRLDGSVTDRQDVYALHALAGSTFYYSLSATSGDVTVTLLDAAGSVVGLTVATGEMAGFHVPSTGTYYLSASQSTNANAGYLIGAMVGPDPPGQGCRPTCFVSI